MVRAQPAVVPGLEEVLSLSLGRLHSCATSTSGTATCWGLNQQGQLGDGSLHNQRNPVAVRGVESIVELVAGETHTCARLSDGRVFCWGESREGQLGEGTCLLSRFRPVAVTGGR